MFRISYTLFLTCTITLSMLVYVSIHSTKLYMNVGVACKEHVILALEDLKFMNDVWPIVRSIQENM